MTKRKAEDKARHFTFLIYPESAPEDWQVKLEAIGLPMAISPIHDKDEVSDAEQKSLEAELKDARYIMSQEEVDKIRKKRKYKKAHYHVIYIAKNAVTASSVRKRIQRALGQKAVALVQIVDNINGMYLYLSHESIDAIENDKHLYDKEGIKHLNNFDIDRYIVLDRADKEDMLKRIREMIVEQGLCNIIEMDKYVTEQGGEYGVGNDGAYQTIIKENSGLLRLYFDGNYQTRMRRINPDNG